MDKNDKKKQQQLQQHEEALKNSFMAANPNAFLDAASLLGRMDLQTIILSIDRLKLKFHLSSLGCCWKWKWKRCIFTVTFYAVFGSHAKRLRQSSTTNARL
jgi:hypothetical protein